MKSKRFLALFLALAMILPLTGTFLPAVAADAAPLHASAGYGHTLVVLSDKTLWAAGSNAAGQLGDGTTVSTDKPVKVMDNVIYAEAGEKHSFAITADNVLWAWGSSEFGVLGVGPVSKSIYATPTKVMDGVQQVATGTNHTVILKTDGTVCVTGRNLMNIGQLGQGKASNYSVTTPEAMMTGVKQISAEADYSLTVKTDGSLWVWGSNESGRLGVANFDTENKTTPYKIADGVAQADCGGSFSYYITTDGQLYGSGSRSLGNGKASDRAARVKIMDGAKSVSAGRNHVAVIKTDGSLWVWGENGDGQLGLGHGNTVTTPAQVKQSGVTLVSAGSRHTMAIIEGGLWAWGFNGKGRLCDGTQNDSNVPVKAMSSGLQQPPTPSVDVVPKPGTAASSWSSRHIGLIASVAPAGIQKDYAQAISRAELAALSVAMYQALSGRKVTDTETHIHAKFFHDITFHGTNSTPDMNLIYAYEYGLVDARTFRYFEPKKAATRDEVFAAVVRVAQAAGLKLNPGTAVSGETAADTRYRDDIRAAWANGLVTAEADPALRAKEVATREVALYLFGLLYEKRAALKPAGLGVPTLLWGYGGINQDWSYEWHYSAPAVVKNASTGKMEIISSSYHITSLDAVSGKVNWRVTTGTDRSTAVPSSFSSDSRTWDDVVVADLDGDGKQWIVAAHDNGKISVLDMNGNYKSGWANKVVADGRHIRSLAVADINKDGKMEIVVGATGDSSVNTWVFDSKGSIMPGWPNLTQSGPYVWAFGIYSDNISLGDLDGDGDLEIIVPSDTKSVAIYHHDGKPFATGSAYGNVPWHEVQFWRDYAYEQTPGYKNERDPSTPESQRIAAQMGHSSAVVKDIDGDGKNEIVLTAILFDNIAGYPPSHYTTAFVLNADHTRYKTSLGDWTTPPVTGAPVSGLSEVNTALQRPRYNPVVEDLDGDGKCEILFASYDGKLHCFSLDKTEKNSWPYTVYTPGQGSLTYASVPTVLDINGDGKKEVIFTTWCDKDGAENGKLVILSDKGVKLTEADLPFTIGSITNGGMASPVIQDVNGDGVYEAIISTSMSGISVYTLPGSTTKAGTATPPATPSLVAKPTSSPVLVDGKNVAFDAYNIEGSNYFKLRDLAYVLNGTGKQFEVSWDAAANAISLTSGKAYTADGSEMKAKGAGEQSPKATTSKILLDGKEVKLTAYNIGGNNYFKLRDVGQAFDFAVSWDETARTIAIVTTEGYTAK